MQVVIGRTATGRQRTILLLAALASTVVLSNACTNEDGSPLSGGADMGGGDVLGYQPLLPADTGGSDPTGTEPVLPGAPASPSGLLVATVAGGEIQLTWTDNSDNEEGFRIDRLTSGEWAEYATTGPDVTVFTDQGATSEMSYCYRVAAFNLTGMSEFPQTVCSELDAEEAYVDAMRALPPLPKVHFSWPLERSYLLDNPDDPRLYEYIRISQAVSFCGYYASAEQVDALLRVAGQVQADHPELRIHVGVNYSPWLRVFPADAPPTDFGPAHAAEVEMYRERMLRAKDRLAQANAAYGSNLTIDVLLLDSERFQVKSADESDYQAWNDAITAKNNAFHWVSKEVFPEARVDWYPRRPGLYFTFDEVGEGFSTSSYYMPDLALIRRLVNQTYALALERGDPRLTVWVALGAGYVISEQGQRWFEHDKTYDVSFSWQLGAELNEPGRAAAAVDLAAWNSVTTAVFYPAPFRLATPGFPRHFLAYVRGAHGLPDSP